MSGMPELRDDDGLRVEEDQAQIAELQKLLIDLDSLQSIYETNKIAFYKPLDHKRAKFHHDQSAFVRLVLGSNRSSKTVSATAEAIAHSLGFRPWLDPDDPDYWVRMPDGTKIPVPNIGRVVAQNYQQSVMQTIWPKFQEWAPRGQYKVKRDQRGIPVRLDWSNGSITYFMSYDQDPMAFEGTAGHWAYLDEPPPYHVYTGIKRGLVDHGGHMWMAMTPLTQPWIHDKVVSRAGNDDGAVVIYKFSIWDNCVENGGYLTREAIEEFLSDLREDDIEARLHGNFLHLAGRVYKEWNPEPPYWIPPFEIPRSWPRVCLIDPHPRKPIAVMWAAVSPDNQWYAYDCMFEHRFNRVEQVVEMMREKEKWGKNGKVIDTSDPVVLRIIDTSAQENEPTSGLSIRMKFAEFGIHCQLARKRNKTAGLEAIHAALALRNDWSEPQFVVFNNCLPIKHDFQNYCWDDWQISKQRDLKGDKQETRKIHDDFMDLIRYIFQAKLSYGILRPGLHQWENSRQVDVDQNFRGRSMSNFHRETIY